MNTHVNNRTLSTLRGSYDRFSTPDGPATLANNLCYTSRDYRELRRFQNTKYPHSVNYHVYMMARFNTPAAKMTYRCMVPSVCRAN